MEITSSVVSGKDGADDQMISTSNIARKNMAATKSATLKTYKSRRSDAVCVTYACNRRNCWCRNPYNYRVIKQDNLIIYNVPRSHKTIVIPSN